MPDCANYQTIKRGFAWVSVTEFAMTLNSNPACEIELDPSIDSQALTKARHMRHKWREMRDTPEIPPGEHDRPMLAR
jgi:hypothetical protein